MRRYHSLVAAQSLCLQVLCCSWFGAPGMLFRPLILRYDSLPSTNTEAARQAISGASEGLCVVAREQTEGRGRQQRVWLSPPDAGLYFSLVLRPRMEVSGWPLLTLMAALAVTDALAETCGLATDIKWPNDIYAAERKLGGLLAEIIETPQGRACILGIGLNLKESAFPEELRESAVAVETLTGSAPDVERLLESLTRSLALRYEALQSTGGAERTLDEWSEHSSYAKGKRVRVALEGKTLIGITRGLERDGALRVETESGELRIIRAGDVTALRPTAT